VRYGWKVPEQKIGEFLLGAKSSANSNNRQDTSISLVCFK
jgi:hypothetical protein